MLRKTTDLQVLLQRQHLKNKQNTLKLNTYK